MIPLFEDHLAMDTDGDSCIRRASSSVLARLGATVIVCNVNDVDGEETAHQIRSFGGQALFFRAKVSSGAEVEAVIGGPCSLLSGIIKGCDDR